MTVALLEVGRLDVAELVVVVVDVGVPVAFMDGVVEVAVFRQSPASQTQPGVQQEGPSQHVVPWGQQPKCRSVQSQSGGRKTQGLCYACSFVVKGVMVRRTFATRNCSKAAARHLSHTKCTNRTAGVRMAACWR